jgi:hypothetical protein
MRIEQFRMERMQSRFENYVDYNLSESGVEPMRPEDLLSGAPEREQFLRTALGYCQSNGTEELRDRIAQFYDGAERDNVLVTNGGSEANYATLWSILERGDRVACMLPNYMQAWGLSRAYAGHADPFRLVLRPDGSGGRRWGLDLDGFRRAVTKKTRVILVTNPNNPTGGVLSGEEVDEIVRAARRVGAFIVADEIYRGAELSGPTTPSFWGRYDKVIITSGLSKAFGLPGLRIGWVVGPARLVEKFWSHHDYTTIAPGMLSDFLARLAMEPARRDAIFERTRSIVRRNWPVLEGWIRGHGWFLSCVAPRAGAIAFIRYDLPIGSIALCERLRVEKSVLIVPGDQLGVGRHVRIGFGYGADDSSMRAGLARIDELFHELLRGRSPAAERRLARPAPAAGRGAQRPRAAPASRLGRPGRERSGRASTSVSTASPSSGAEK